MKLKPIALIFATALFATHIEVVIAGAPGHAEKGPLGIGAATSGGDSDPRVKKLNQYALTSSTVIRQLLSDAKAM